MSTIWGFHAKEMMDERMLQGIIAIGWEELGDLSSIEKTREAYKAYYASVFTKATKQAVATSAGTIFRFINEAKIGDYVVFPSKSDRKINIGRITGEYHYNSSVQYYPNERSVEWIKSFPRNHFSQSCLYELGAFLSFFKIKSNCDEIFAVINGNNILDDMDDTILVAADGIEDATKDYILKQLSTNLKGYPLEDFIANLLKAMGYMTKVSPQGGDSGIDITAYKDELPPRILVQVKSQDSDIKETTLQSLKGAMREGDYGLFVTLSDYTKNARNYLDNTPIIRGINGKELVELILKYYENLDERYRDLISLKKVYVPVYKQDNEQ